MLFFPPSLTILKYRDSESLRGKLVNRWLSLLLKKYNMSNVETKLYWFYCSNKGLSWRNYLENQVYVVVF